MVCANCKNCKKFKTNDCTGLSSLNKETCANKLNEDCNQVDTSGCC